MLLNLRVGLLVGALVLAVALVMGNSLAHAASGGTKPGWGYGDKNHVHTGPPGQSVSVNAAH